MAAVAASALRKSGSPSISQTTCPSTSIVGLGRITCRSRTSPPGLTASTMLPRTCTTSSGSTHQSDQEKTTRSNECGSISISLPEATR